MIVDGLNDRLGFGQRNDYALAARGDTGKPENQAGDVEHRKRQEVTQSAVQSKIRKAGDEVRVPIEVSQDDAFGTGGGAAGEDDHAGIFVLDELVYGATAVARELFAQRFVHDEAERGWAIHLGEERGLYEKCLYAGLLED